jgi:hypothetical protein
LTNSETAAEASLWPAALHRNVSTESVPSPAGPIHHRRSGEYLPQQVFHLKERLQKKLLLNLDL